MATPPTLRAFEVAWPPPPTKDAAHIYVADRTKEKVVEVDGQLHLLIPIVKEYEDPDGFRDKIPRKVIEDASCPLCRSITVSKTQDEHCSWEKQLTQALINPFTFL